MSHKSPSSLTNQNKEEHNAPKEGNSWDTTKSRGMFSEKASGGTSCSSQRMHPQMDSQSEFKAPQPPQNPKSKVQQQQQSFPPEHSLNTSSVTPSTPKSGSLSKTTPTMPSRGKAQSDAAEKLTSQASRSSQVAATVKPNIPPPSQGSGKPAKTVKICHVCGDVAKSNHFGGVSCDSCKAFFRRAVLNDSHEGFRCVQKTGECKILISNRKVCQLCRFNKCLQIGMEKSWVMSEEERNNLQKQRKGKQMPKDDDTESSEPRSEASTSNEASASSAQTKMQAEVAYVPDKSTILTFMSADDEKDIQMLCDEFERSYIEVPYQVPNRVNRDAVEIIDMFTTILRRMVFYFKKLPCFESLQHTDQSVLLRQSILELCMLRSALSFNTEKCYWPVQTKGLKNIENCPVLNAEDMSRLVSPELFEMQMQFIEGIKQLKADEPTIMLLSLIVLFYPDRDGVDDIKSVGNVQDRYLETLRKYVCWRYGPDSSRIYARYLTKLTDLRQLNDKHNQFNLNLAPAEIEMIKTQLGMINLNPYKEWDILGDQEGTVVGNVDPTERWSSMRGPTAAQKRRADNPTDATSSGQTPTSNPRNFDPSDISSFFRPPFAGLMFNHIVNTQIPILIEDPNAVISNEQELANMKNLFAAFSPNIPTKIAPVDPQVASTLAGYDTAERRQRPANIPANATHSSSNQQLSSPSDAPLDLTVDARELANSGYKHMLESLGDINDPNFIQRIKSSLSPETLAQLRRSFGPNIPKIPLATSHQSASIPTDLSSVNATNENVPHCHYNGGDPARHGSISDTQPKYPTPHPPLMTAESPSYLPPQSSGLESTLQNMSITHHPSHYLHERNADIRDYQSNAYTHSVPTDSIGIHDHQNKGHSIDPQYYYAPVPGPKDHGSSLHMNHCVHVSDTQIQDDYQLEPLELTTRHNEEFISSLKHK